MSRRRRAGLFTALIGLAIAAVGAGVALTDSTSAASDAALPGSAAVTRETAASPSPGAPSSVAPSSVAPTSGSPTSGSPATAPSSSVTTTEEPSSSEPDTADEQILDFLDRFVAAIDGGDEPTLSAALHPVVLEEFGAELCATFIEREILALSDYRATGPVVGPATRSILGNVVTKFYEIPVSFEFGGQTFESAASFALVDGEVFWFTECR